MPAIIASLKHVWLGVMKFSYLFEIGLIYFGDEIDI
jgi:hypothetical protein